MSNWCDVTTALLSSGSGIYAGSLAELSNWLHIDSFYLTQDPQLANQLNNRNDLLLLIEEDL